VPKRVTLKDVAALAGVSYQTVSKVINNKAQVTEDTRRRVWSAVEELGYRPNVIARSLQGSLTRTIAFAIRPVSHRISDPFFNELLTSMVEAAGSQQYDMLASVTETGDQEMETYERLIKTGRVDGIVIDGTTRHDERLMYLSRDGFPFIAFGRSELDLNFPYVDVDNFAGMFEVVEHLVGLGHQRIAFIGLPSHSLGGDRPPEGQDTTPVVGDVVALPQQSFCGHERRRAYQEALASHGMALDPTLLIIGHRRERGGYGAANHLLDLSPPPTAIACGSDLVALGVMRAAQDQGMEVGRDLAVTGFDGIPLSAYTHPPLTTVEQPIKRIGELLISVLVRIIEGTELSDTERHVVLQPKLIMRQSSTGTS